MKRGSVYRAIIALILLSALIPCVLADTNVTFSQGLTFTTPFGFRLSFGLENILPPAWAFLFYNGMALFALFFIGGFASLRSTRFSLFCIDAFAAIFWWFGWMNFYIAATNSVNWWTPMQLIILAGVMGGAIYLKEANRERYGTGGTGLTLINALYYIILLQTIIGFVNVTGIWNVNSAVTPTAYQYNNVDLQQQVSSNANTGGFMGGIVSTAIGFATMGYQALQMIFTVVQGICGYDSILFAAFPWITLSPSAMAFVWVFRIVILLLDGWFVFLVLFKPPPLDNLGV
jgi:hypothetical protein